MFRGFLRRELEPLLAEIRRTRVDPGPPADALEFRLGQAAILAQRAARDTFTDLWEAEVQVYSQWGEDGIIDYLCDCLSLARPRALELGAGNFLECNTRFLAENRSASVVAVDARSDLGPTLASLPLYWRTSVWALSEWITPETVPGIVARARSLMGGLDIVSLDVDGNDYWVAERLDLEGVGLVILEYNALFGHQRAVTVPRDDQFDRSTAHPSWQYWGASLRAWVDLMRKRGFSIVGTNRACFNAFFCPTARLDDIPLPAVDTADLSRYVDSRIRDSRGADGNLSYLAGRARVDAIRDMPVIDVVTGERITVGAANP